MHRVHSSGRHVGTAVIKTLKRPFNSNILTFPVVQKAIYQEYDLQYLKFLAFDSHFVSTFGGVFSILHFWDVQFWLYLKPVFSKKDNATACVRTTKDYGQGAPCP